MKRAISILLTIMMLALPMAAGAQADGTGATQTENVDEQSQQVLVEGAAHAAAKSAGEGMSVSRSLIEAWNVFAGAFSDAYERIRDDSVLREASDVMRDKLTEVGDSIGDWLEDVRSGVDERMEEAGKAVDGWLDEHDDDLHAAADSIGEGVGKVVNGFGAFINELFK